MTSPPDGVSKSAHAVTTHHGGPQQVNLTQQEKAMRLGVICAALIVFFSEGFPFTSLSEPAVMLLLGYGLIGLAEFAREKIEDVTQDSTARDRKEKPKGTRGAWA